MIKKTIASALFFYLCVYHLCFGQNPSPSQIERSQEIINKEQVLREKIEKEEKVFIKKIIVKGVTLFIEDRINEIILPFQNRWLSQEEIQGLIDLVRTAYQQKGLTNQPAKISFKIKRHTLNIQVEELTH